MKEYKENGLEFKYKDYLTEDEFINIIKIYIQNLVDGVDDLKDNLSLTTLNYILADVVFDRTLGLYCVENLTEELHSKIFEHGVYDFLRQDIKNANRAYNLAQNIVKNSSSFEEIIRSFLQEFAASMPENINIEEMKSLWDKVSSEYKDIVYKSTKKKPIKDEA